MLQTQIKKILSTKLVTYMTEQQIQDIISLYNHGLSTVKISQTYDTSTDTILKILHKHNVLVRSNKENSRKYSVNHSVFSDISTEEQAYWLGFIAADGYIASTNGKRFGVCLSSKDYNHLIKMNSFLCSTYPIKEYEQKSWYKNGSMYCRLIICSDAIYDDLNTNGVVEHKTTRLKWPTLRSNLEWHYLRGYCDGNGCITRNGNSYCLKFECCDEFAMDIVSFVSNEAPINYSTYRRRKGCKSMSLAFFGKSAYYIIRNMYEGASIYLDRKMLLANKSLEYFSLLYQK